MEATKAKEVCPTTTQNLVKEGALLVDVREWNEVNAVAFDVPDITVIPLSEFENRWREIPKDRDVILVCKAGIRSLKATYYLMNQGYYRVTNMQYGMDRWLQKNFPVKGNASTTKKQNIVSSCCGSTEEKAAASSSVNAEENVSCCGSTGGQASSACEPVVGKSGLCC